MVESNADRKKKKDSEKKKAKMTVKDMKIYDPEAYYRYKMQQDAIKNSPVYLEQKRLEDLRKAQKQQQRREYYR